MDLNNNNILSTDSTNESIKVRFQNEIEINMVQIPNKDHKFDFSKFNRNERRPFSAQIDGRVIETKNDLKRISSLIDSQTKNSSCQEQFINLINDKLDETGLNDKFSRRMRICLTNAQDNLSEQCIDRFDQLIKPGCAVDLKEYLLNLVIITKRALRLCNESTNITKSNLVNCANECDNLKPASMTRDELILFLDTPSKVLMYRDRLKESIKKLNNDLVDELQIRDSIYLRRDEIFLRIERLTKLCLQAIESNSLNDNPEV